MAFYYKGRYLGETPWESQANLERRELQDVVYNYIVNYFDVTEVAETLSRMPTTPAEWAEDAMKSILESGGSSMKLGGLTYRNEAKKPAARKTSGRKAGPMASNSTRSKARTPARGTSTGSASRRC